MDSAGKTFGQQSLNKKHFLGHLASQDIGTIGTSSHLQRGRVFFFDKLKVTELLIRDKYLLSS